MHTTTIPSKEQAFDDYCRTLDDPHAIMQTKKQALGRYQSVEQVESTRETLAGTAQTIIDSMTVLIARLENEGNNAVINGIGELQGLATRLDGLCHQFDAKQESARLIIYMLEDS